MAITMTPLGQLDSAFQEVDAAEEDLKKKEEQEENAQTEAGKTLGLAAAARRELKNAQARYLVLSNVEDAETKDLQRAKAQLEEELAVTEAGLTRAGQTGEEVQAFKNILDKTVEAVKRGKTAAGAAAKSVKDTASETRQAEADATGPDKATLTTSAEHLDTHYTEINDMVSKLGGSQRQIEAEVRALARIATSANDQVISLTAKKHDLERKLNDIGEALDERPGGDLEEAREELDTAEQAHDVAPDAERQGRTVLKQARQAREEAEERLRLARAQRDKVERLFIRGIDVSGPDANGTFTAKAEVRQRIPSTYRLHWSSSAGSVHPKTSKPDEAVNFKTSGLPPGSYDIEVCLERVP